MTRYPNVPQLQDNCWDVICKIGNASTKFHARLCYTTTDFGAFSYGSEFWLCCVVGGCIRKFGVCVLWPWRETRARRTRSGTIGWGNRLENAEIYGYLVNIYGIFADVAKPYNWFWGTASQALKYQVMPVDISNSCSLHQILEEKCELRYSDVYLHRVDNETV